MRDFSIDLIWAKIQIAFTALGGWLGYFLGGMDGLLIALIVFAVLDYITGVMCAIEDKTLSSAVGFRGIARKVIIFMLVGVGHILDIHVVGTGSALRTAVIFFYLSNEGISLLENAAHLGLPIPEKLKAILEQIHSRSKKNDNSEVFSRMILSHSGMVFAESNVQAPMERVFNAPMASGGVRKFRYIQQRRNIIVRFFRSGFILNHSRFHHTYTAKICPLGIQLQKVRVSTEIVFSGFDPAMTFLLRFCLADMRIKLRCFQCADKVISCFLAQRRLIVF